MSVRKSIHFLFLLLLGVVFSGAVYTPEMVPNVQLQDGRRYVSDPEGRFTAEERGRMDSALSQLRERYGVEVALVVVPQVEGDDPVGFTVELFELWGLGDAERDNGLLILYIFEPVYRTIRFEVGYGLEGLLPDARAFQLINNILVPGIKEGREAESFLSLFEELGNLLEGSEEGAYVATSEEEDSFLPILKGWIVLSLIVGGVYAFFMLVIPRRKQRPADALQSLYNHPLYHQGLFVLSFLTAALVIVLPVRLLLFSYYRRRAKNCPACGTKGSVERRKQTPLHALTPLQTVEQKVGSYRFEQIECSVCNYSEVLPIRNFAPNYTKCSRCGGRTFHLASQERISRNRVERTYVCEFCHHTRKERISHDSGGGPIFPGGGMGRGGGFGGGGFGGGGFGGGSSGGGGATVRF